ncbi:Xenotropic and polytropic retrovirus receptor 1 [Recurvomyces mirabilis]|uniref:Xenotropic and polytropic retrovirus receptor 1 n=1 Tax=Recurvomyces mirabilis TaxID=574656 RepID=A0AAE1C680_9PEZI|nr:Xenotropic and polytropic retrovirus receptor 1 [Recurvomyces mirabilis]KAK5161746.1 Xenotropic and polytropic retrovirus receptor 1 [Recurvomyces mirabilis]
MKFAKDLDDNAVPEWKSQYLDYKHGKKKLKAVTKAIRNVEKPEDKEKVGRKSPFSSLRDAPVHSLFQREPRIPAPQPETRDSDRSHTPLFKTRSRSEAPSPQARRREEEQEDGSHQVKTFPMDINERSPLRTKKDQGPKLTRYGSIIGTPPDADTPVMAALRQAPSLTLPDPAIPSQSDPDYDRPVSPGSPVAVSKPPPSQLAHTGNAYQVTKPTDGPPSSALSTRLQALRTPKRANSTPDGGNRPFVRRMFSIAPTNSGPSSGRDVALEQYREVDFRQAEFFLFLDKELGKIEKFYKQKEDEAEARLKVLREQLHVMRDRRLEEILAMEQKHKHPPPTATTAPPVTGDGGHIDWVPTLQVPPSRTGLETATDDQAVARRSHPFKASIEVTRDALEKVKPGHVGKTSQAMNQLSSPARALGVGAGQEHDPSQDYTRRPTTHTVPYRVAKRKLKIALGEYYRGLELLKSYALLNRTAFRKINKKYDKAVNAHPNLRYMAEKVNKAHFVMSTTPDDLISQTEDLYARYFERGNHKIAVGKLRARIAKAGNYTGPVFRTGILLALGAVFGIQGLVYSVLRLNDKSRAMDTEFLQQIYAGWFLILASILAFCFDCAVFSRFRVNYQFIFELDNRHMLHWEQLAEIPSYVFLSDCILTRQGLLLHLIVYVPVPVES